MKLLIRARLWKIGAPNIGDLRELNNAVSRLILVEAKDLLVKELAPLIRPLPKPVTKEYYLYHLALSGLEALKKIDPELAKK